MTKISLIDAAKEHLKQVYFQLVLQEVNKQEVDLVHLHAYPEDWKKRSPEEKKKWLDAKHKQYKVVTAPIKNSIRALETYIEGLEEKPVKVKSKKMVRKE